MSGEAALAVERRALEVLDRLLDLPEEQRRAELDQLARGDPQLAQLAARLLAGSMQADDPVRVEALPTLRHLLDELVFQERIGSFEITGWIGSGGMGWVLEGRQGDPPAYFAIKLIRPDRLRPDTVERFRREAEFLTRLQHPGIARIYVADVEATARGPRPYVVMERVDGPDLRAYLDEGRGAPRERLELFLAICAAVHYAHQRPVIHCDLKPENVLLDASGNPKLVDFGIARALDSSDEPAAATRAYASPEQLAGGDVDVRADVYALGVLLRELGPANADLEAIAARAAARERDERYGSVAELAEDVRRHLRHEPVTARAATAGYRLSKLVRRRTGWVVGGAATLIVACAGFGTTAYWLDRAVDARDAAEAEAEKARNINAFFGELLRSANPWERGRDVTVAALLDDASARMEGELAGEPEVLAFMQRSIGSSYLSLGRLEEAEALLGRAHAGYLRALGPEHLDTLGALEDRGVALRELGRLEEAEALLEQTWGATAAQLGRDDPRALRSMGRVAQVRYELGRFDESFELAEETLERQRRALGPDARELDDALNLIGSIHYERREFERAEAVLRELVERNEARFPAGHASVVMAKNNLVVALLENGELDEAEDLARSILPDARAALGEEHPVATMAVGNLAVVLFRKGAAEEAEDLFRASFEGLERELGPGHPRTLMAGQALGSFLSQRGQLNEAELLLSEVLDGQQRALGDPLHPDALTTMWELALIYRATSQLDRALALFEELGPALRAARGPDHEFLPNVERETREVRALLERN